MLTERGGDEAYRLYDSTDTVSILRGVNALLAMLGVSLVAT